MNALDTLRDPAVLFFVLGFVSVFVKSNIRIPMDVAKFFSLYLLMALGFKGGLSLAKTPLTLQDGALILCAILLSFLVPFIVFAVLRFRKMDTKNAAAIAATYGSVSAVTFIAATALLDRAHIKFSGTMVAVLALMESPAIISALLLAGMSQRKESSLPGGSSQSGFKVSGILHEAFFNGSVFLLLGSLLVGYLCEKDQAANLQFFIYDLFKGILCFFLLNMGILAGQNFSVLRKRPELMFFAVLFPLINASLAFGLLSFFTFNPSDAFLLITLAASASYIAVPAALQICLPDANPGLYLSMALGVTFPFNIVVGIPIYLKFAFGAAGAGE